MANEIYKSDIKYNFVILIILFLSAIQAIPDELKISQTLPGF